MSIFTNTAAAAAATLRLRAPTSAAPSNREPGSGPHRDSLHTVADDDLAVGMGTPRSRRSPGDDERDGGTGGGGRGGDPAPEGKGGLVVAIAFLLGLVALVALNMK